MDSNLINNFSLIKIYPYKNEANHLIFSYLNPSDLLPIILRFRSEHKYLPEKYFNFKTLQIFKYLLSLKNFKLISLPNFDPFIFIGENIFELIFRNLKKIIMKFLQSNS